MSWGMAFLTHSTLTQKSRDSKQAESRDDFILMDYSQDSQLSQEGLMHSATEMLP